MSRVLSILFNGDMVRAILDGRKTVTRRVIKPQPKSKLCYTFAGSDCGTWGYPSKTAHESWGEEYRLPDNITKEDLGKRWNPPYHTDDVLYVRETWHKYKKRVGKGEGCHIAEFYGYKASVANSEDANEPWHPSIHMPKEAARIWLRVKDVRVERLQEITEEQAEAEGAKQCYEQIHALDNRPVTYLAEDGKGYYVLGFKSIWNSTIKKTDLDRYGWDANPWVWVIEFERCENPAGWGV